MTVQGKEETDWKRAIGFCDRLLYTLFGHSRVLDKGDECRIYALKFKLDLTE